MPVAAKTAWQFWWYLSNNSNVWKIFEGELFIQTPFTSLLQIFCKFMLYSEVIFQNVTGPDGTGQVDLQALMGQTGQGGYSQQGTGINLTASVPRFCRCPNIWKIRVRKYSRAPEIICLKIFNTDLYCLRQVATHQMRSGSKTLTMQITMTGYEATHTEYH